MKKTRVLIVTQYYPPENSTRFSDMAKYLHKTLDIHIVSAHPTFPFGSFKKTWKVSSSKMVNGVNLTNLWTWQPSSGDPGFLGRMAYYGIYSIHSTLWALFNIKKYDVIITTSPPIFVYLSGFLVKFLSKKPWIVDVRDLWIDAAADLGFIKKGSITEKISRKLEHICFKNSDKITVTSGIQKDKILEIYEGIDENKICILPNGVDTEVFYPISPNKKTQIIYIGNIGHAYDLEKTIVAMKTVKAKQDIKFLIVGGGDTKEHLSKLVKENNLEDCVIFTGQLPRQEVPKLISESLIGVAPLKNFESIEYIIPIKLYEYMACGIPFIGCGSGEIQNIAKESNAGIVIKNEPEIIAQSIIDLLNNKDKMTEMSSNGVKYVKEHYDRKMLAYKLKSNIDLISNSMPSEKEEA